MKFLLFYGILILCFFARGYSMNIKSLEISYQQNSGNGFLVRVTAYVFKYSPVDDTLQLNWGDSQSSLLHKETSIAVPNDLLKITYTGSHSYIGPGSYILNVNYAYRDATVINIPNANTTNYNVEAMLIINPFIGKDNSPVFQTAPVDNACLNHPYINTIYAYDVDSIPAKDSLSYSIVNSHGIDGCELNGYQRPPITIDSITGQLLMLKPATTGDYAFGIKISEYRRKLLIGYVTRDVTLKVLVCDDKKFPSIIAPINDTCVLEGSVLKIPIVAISSSSLPITLTASGDALMLKANPAIIPQTIMGKDSIETNLQWTPSCKEVRKAPYEFYLKVSDNDQTTTGYTQYLNDFNTKTLGAGWVSNGDFSEGCNFPSDGSPYLWMSYNNPAPRYLISPNFDLSKATNATICFDMRYPKQTGDSTLSPNCEGPDLSDEGVHLQYSTNTGMTWNEIEYWNPALSDPGGFDPALLKWNTYCVNLPDAAKTTITSFRWTQLSISGRGYDHWGLDNIRIYFAPQTHFDVKPFQITVIAPAPKKFTANLVGGMVNLSWESTECTNAIGYKIYRKNSYYGYNPAHCETGVPGYTGYSQIADIPSINTTNFTDNASDFISGNKYCYIIDAYFADGAESYASKEECIEPLKNIPVITNISVNNTDKSLGCDSIKWAKPRVLDTNEYTKPYKYLIYRSEDLLGGSFKLIDSLMGGINDTLYRDTLINTVIPTSYRIDLYGTSNGNYKLVGKTVKSSSVFLGIASSNHRLTLSWDFRVSWINNNYEVYRKNEKTGKFELIGNTSSRSYQDSGLVNNHSYCYYVRSIGDYSSSGYVSPILNNSQQVCASPIDTVPPCSPQLTVNSNCSKDENYLTWINSFSGCASDAIRYKVYYTPNYETPKTELATIGNLVEPNYTHLNTETLSGCYAVTAIDSFSNESKLSNIVCVDIDSCSLYSLPNVFTPDGNTSNELFKPLPYKFVERIEIQIFNRWGNLVFKTTDPDILWNGKYLSTNKECNDGVYFYVCDVYERRLKGLKKRTLNGFVTIIRSNQPSTKE